MSKETEARAKRFKNAYIGQQEYLDRASTAYKKIYISSEDGVGTGNWSDRFSKIAFPSFQRGDGGDSLKMDMLNKLTSTPSTMFEDSVKKRKHMLFPEGSHWFRLSYLDDQRGLTDSNAFKQDVVKLIDYMKRILYISGFNDAVVKVIEDWSFGVGGLYMHHVSTPPYVKFTYIPRENLYISMDSQHSLQSVYMSYYLDMKTIIDLVEEQDNPAMLYQWMEETLGLDRNGIEDYLKTEERFLIVEEIECLTGLDDLKKKFKRVVFLAVGKYSSTNVGYLIDDKNFGEKDGLNKFVNIDNSIILLKEELDYNPICVMRASERAPYPSGIAVQSIPDIMLLYDIYANFYIGSTKAANPPVAFDATKFESQDFALSATTAGGIIQANTSMSTEFGQASSVKDSVIPVHSNHNLQPLLELLRQTQSNLNEKFYAGLTTTSETVKSASEINYRIEEEQVNINSLAIGKIREEFIVPLLTGMLHILSKENDEVALAITSKPIVHRFEHISAYSKRLLKDNLKEVVALVGQLTQVDLSQFGLSVPTVLSKIAGYYDLPAEVFDKKSNN